MSWFVMSCLKYPVLAITALSSLSFHAFRSALGIETIYESQIALSKGREMLLLLTEINGYLDSIYNLQK